MPRAARIDAPGAIQHVTVRGIEKRNIFLDDIDRENFIERLERLLVEASTICFAWALMPNHAHLLLQTGSTPLSTLMARLGTGYARHFNTRHYRSGHLFQNRFHSALASDEVHLRNSVRYIHLNPLRAGLVLDMSHLERYPWTGLSALWGHHPRGFQAVEPVLRWFDDHPERARLALRRWMMESITKSGDAVGAGPDLERAEAPTGSTPEAQVAALGVRVWSIGLLTEWVCTATGADEGEVHAGLRTAAAANARAIVAHLAMSELGHRVDAVGKALGLSESGVSRARRRGLRLSEARNLSLPKASRRS
jgi:putative transposase